MSFSLVFHKLVRPEIDRAYEWYEQKQKGLGEDFLSELDRVFDRLGKQPAVHQMIWKDVRRTLLKRFPYSVMYRVLKKRVQIVAVMYSRRDPALWRSRVK